MPDLSKLSVLLVDDNRNMRALLRRLLISEGMRQIHDAADGTAGLEVLRYHDCDVVLTNLVMAPMDGLEFTRRVRKSRNTINHLVPIIMITTYPEKQQVEAARDAGVTEFLVKPIRPGHLLARFNAIFERPRSFVEAGSYLGPDRRRKGHLTGSARRIADKPTKT